MQFFSGLMGMFEKRRFKSFLGFVNNFDEDNPKTHDIFNKDSKACEIYEKFGLDKNTQDFTGHALALHTCDK